MAKAYRGGGGFRGGGDVTEGGCGSNKSTDLKSLGIFLVMLRKSFIASYIRFKKHMIEWGLVCKGIVCISY